LERPNISDTAPHSVSALSDSTQPHHKERDEEKRDIPMSPQTATNSSLQAFTVMAFPHSYIPSINAFILGCRPASMHASLDLQCGNG